MKKYVTLIALSVLGVSISFAQSINNINIEAIEKQIESKAMTFCKYVVAVGTTAGQVGAVSDEAKTDIIKNRVPGLFWDYEEAPRYMLTTNGPYGKTIRKRKMSDYFKNLRAQSRSGLNSARKYELRYEGIIVNNKNSFKFKLEKTLSDGSELWSTIIRIAQIYTRIDFNSPNPDNRVVIWHEINKKDFRVYVIIKPNGKAGVYLGDVKRAYNE